MQRLALVGLVLGALGLGVGCGYPVPDEGATAFSSSAPALPAAVESAAQTWADAGLVIAGSVVVSDAPGGVPVRFLSRADLTRTCEDASREGCVTSTAERFTGVWLLEGLSPAKLQRMVNHELIHALVPDAPHLDDAQQGLTAALTSGLEPTAADMANVCSHAECADLGDAGPDASGR